VNCVENTNQTTDNSFSAYWNPPQPMFFWPTAFVNQTWNYFGKMN